MQTLLKETGKGGGLFVILKMQSSPVLITVVVALSVCLLFLIDVIVAEIP